MYSNTCPLQGFCKTLDTHMLQCCAATHCISPFSPPILYLWFIHVYTFSSSSRSQISSIVKGRCLCIVRRSPHVKTPPSSHIYSYWLLSNDQSGKALTLSEIKARKTLECIQVFSGTYSMYCYVIVLCEHFVRSVVLVLVHTPCPTLLAK